MGPATPDIVRGNLTEKKDGAMHASEWHDISQNNDYLILEMQTIFI